MDKFRDLLIVFAAFNTGLVVMWLYMKLLATPPSGGVHLTDADVKKMRDANQPAWKMHRDKHFTQAEYDEEWAKVVAERDAAKCPVVNCRIRLKHSHTEALIEGIKSKRGKA